MRYTHFITLPTSDFIIEGTRNYAILPDTVDHVLSVKINGIELKYTFNTISKELTLLPVGRSFKRLTSRSYWVLPIGIDRLVESMEKARADKNWEVADTIRKSLTDIGIVVRNGKDWYPNFIESEVRAEKDFTSWLYSTLDGLKDKLVKL